MSRDDPNAPSRAAPARAPATCRWCGRVLSALARVRGDVCDAMDCRRRDVDAQAATRRALDLGQVRAAVARAGDAPALAGAPVVWLRHHAADVAPPAPMAVDTLRAHLMALEADAVPTSPPAADAAEAAVGPEIAGHLCALCRGRCCRFGLPGKAFIEARQLREWLAPRPGANWVDAVEHYLGFIAPEHLDESCLFHSTTGCTLPRERRSDVCNQFACDTLEQVRDLGATTVVVGISASRALHGTAALSAQGSRALPGPPEPAQLPWKSGTIISSGTAWRE